MKRMIAWSFGLMLSASALAAEPSLFLPLPSGGEGDMPPGFTDALKKIEARATTKSVELFSVNVNALKADSTTLALADAPPVVASRRTLDVDPKKPSEFVWTGSLVGIPGDATFVVRDDAIVGTIRNGLELYRVEALENGVHAVIHINQDKFPEEEPPSQRNRLGKKPLGELLYDSAPMADAPPPVIDVLVAYTPNAKASTSDIESLVKLAIAESNRSYQNSQIAVQLRLVEILPIKKYKEPTNFDSILNDFIKMKDVKKRVAATGADVAMLVMNHRAYCGLANEIGAAADTAFAIVHFECATGYYSFAHEIGHLMGARHDVDNDPETQPFAYGHGYQHTGAKGWRTIMAYNCSPSCPRLMYWSNPNITYEGVSMGSAAQSDNARVLNGSARIVAAFRSVPPPHVAQATKEPAEKGASGITKAQ